MTWDPGWFFDPVYFQVEKLDPVILGPCEGFYTGEHPTYPHLQRQCGLQTTSFAVVCCAFYGGVPQFSLFYSGARGAVLGRAWRSCVIAKSLGETRTGKPSRLSETLISYGFKQPNGRGCTSYGFPRLLTPNKMESFLHRGTLKNQFVNGVVNRAINPISRVTAPVTHS